MIAGITEKEQKIIERILDKYRKDYAFFYYGSRVKGTYGKTSDLDVLIKGKAEMPLAVLQEIKEEFDKSDLPYIVNFSDYYKLDSSFYERIKPDIIPYKWQEVKLGDFLIINPSERLPKGTIAKKVSMEKLQPFSRDVSGYELDEFSGGAKFRNKDTIMARITPCLENGKRAQINILKQGEVGFGSTEFIVFREKGNISDANFIYYLVCSDLIRSPAIKSMVGSSGRQRVQTDVLENLRLFLPPLEVQKKIAGVLGALDDKIELNNKINQNLEAQAQALFKSWFVDFEPFGGKMPSDWKIGKLDDIVDFYNGYPFKSNELLDKNVEGRCLHVFKQGHIKRGGGFNSDSTKSYFPKEKTKDKEKYILKKGDILMAMTDMKGNVAILGNTALMGTSDKFIVNQRVGLLRCKNIYGISYPYIYLLTNSTDFLHDLRNRANSGVQVNLSSQEIKNSELLIPDTKTNTVFNTVSKTFFEKIFENEKENLRLTELRDTLLPKLMSGEINVDDVKILADKSSFTGEI